MTTPCPMPDRLQALLDGRLPKADLRQCTEHLEHCDQCRTRLEELAGEVEGIPAATRPEDGSGAEPTPAVQRAMDRLRATVFDTQGQGTSDTQPEAVDFLTPTDKPGYIGCFGPYDVNEVVGRGGMGVVLKARDPSLHRIVAIKVLSPALATSAVARQRFIREARAAAAVSHDHVVTIHAVDEVHRLPYLMMQFISGKSLQSRLDRSGPLQPKEVLRIGMQTASGLAAAHALGLIHRDVKPANVLLENGIERAMLTDFGLAKAAHDAAITQTGLIAGTPEYMAPEQVRDEPIDHRADLFSLGGVLYAMCTGRPPFMGSTPLSVMRKVCEESPPAIREINEEIPGWLAEIVQRLLSKDRSQRYQSANEVARLLGEWLARLQSPDSPAAGGAEPSRPDRSRAERWIVRSVIGGLLVALVAAVFGLRALLDPGPEPVHIPGGPQPEPAPIASQTFMILAEGDGAGRTFETLAAAIDAAQSGDTIEVCWDGKFETKPIEIPPHKALIIRAAEGFRPMIRVRSDESPLLSTDALLVLEGLALQRARPEFPPRFPPVPRVPLIKSGGAELYVTNCHFLVRSPMGPVPNRSAVYLDRAASCQLRNCEFYGRTGTAVLWSHQGIAAGAGRPSSTLSVNNCVHRGTWVLLLEYGGEDTASLRLVRNTLCGQSLIHHRRESTPQTSRAKLTVEASQNVFHFRDLLQMVQGDSLRQCFAWEGRQNLFCVGEGFGFLATFPSSAMFPEDREDLVGRNLQDWSEYWNNNTDNDSLLASDVIGPHGDFLGRGKLLRFRPGGGRPPVVKQPPTTPEDFRIAEVELDDGGSLLEEDRAKYGADLDWVGPGKYDDWRKTDQYREWLEEVRRAVAASK